MYLLFTILMLYLGSKYYKDKTRTQKKTKQDEISNDLLKKSIIIFDGFVKRTIYTLFRDEGFRILRGGVVEMYKTYKLYHGVKRIFTHV